MNIQSISHNHMQGTSINSIDVSYDSHESFKQHLIYSAMQKVSIFHAMDLINEVNKLNNKQMLNTYELKNLKNHFLKNKSGIGNEKFKSENTQKDFLKNKMATKQSLTNHFIKTKMDKPQMTIIENSNIEIKDKQKRNPYAELQKAYMKMYSY